MAPKEQKSKKAIREKSAQRLDDATFGLKNKNKSKKVQAFVSQVEKGVKHSDGSAARAENNKMKKDAKAAKLLEEETLRQLLGEGLMGQHGKKVVDMKNTAAELGLTEVSEEVQKLLDEFSSDSEDSENERKEKRKTIYLDSEDEVADGGEQVFREKTLEDLIEDQRKALQESGVPGTPITEKSFAEWKARKEERKRKEAEERVKAEQTKKKGGKGLAVLSGRELFAFDATLFKDDDGAANKAQEIELLDGIKLDKAAEEAMEAQELLKAQAEQDRLMAAEKVEREARRLKDEERCRVAALRENLFELGGIMVNEEVFIEDEKEDLSPFDEDPDDDDEDEMETEEARE